MVPSSEQPVRASKVAELVDLALRIAPPGVHVAAPELVWQAGAGRRCRAWPSAGWACRLACLSAAPLAQQLRRIEHQPEVQRHHRERRALQMRSVPRTRSRSTITR
jgi:hypothetical protein